MARVFLSHSSANNAQALALRDWMSTQGWNDVFLDLDPARGLVAGQRWQDAARRDCSKPKRYRIRAVEVRTLEDMHVATKVRVGEEASERIGVLNAQSAALDDPAGGAVGVRFHP